MVASRAVERLGTTGMSIGVNEAHLPETTNGTFEPLGATESVKRDAETTRYFLWRPGIIMLAIWASLGANSIDEVGLRPLDANTPGHPRKLPRRR